MLAAHVHSLVHLLPYIAFHPSYLFLLPSLKQLLCTDSIAWFIQWGECALICFPFKVGPKQHAL